MRGHLERAGEEGETHKSHGEPLLWLVWRSWVLLGRAQTDLVFRLGVAGLWVGPVALRVQRL